MNDKTDGGADSHEEELLRRWKDGCTESRDQLWRLWAQFIHIEARHALGAKLRGKVDSMDIVQDVFIDLLSLKTPPANLDSIEQLRRFVWVVIRNTVRDTHHFYFTAIRRCGDLERSLSADGGVAAKGRSASEQLAQLEETRRLLAIMALLREPQRAVILLRLESSLSYAEIGEILDCSANAAEKRYSRACDELQRLERRIQAGDLAAILEELEGDHLDDCE